MWLGSGIVRPRPRCSGHNKHVNFGVCLFLTGLREVPEPSDTSTASGHASVWGSNLLRAPVREPLRAPRPYLQRRGELAWARFGSERTPDTSTTSGCSLGFHAIPVRSVSWGQGKMRRKSRGKSGNSNWADYQWQLCLRPGTFVLNCVTFVIRQQCFFLGYPIIRSFVVCYFNLTIIDCQWTVSFLPGN